MGRIIFTLVVAILTHCASNLSIRASETNRPPLVTVRLPYEVVLAGDTYSIEVLAHDPDNNLETVALYRGVNQLVSSSTSGSFNAPVTFTAGTNTFYGVATDRFGLVTTSAVLRVIGNRPPQIQFTSSLQGYPTVQPVVLTATASDPDGTVPEVRLFYAYNFQLIELGRDSAPPYEFIFNPPDAGVYVIHAYAYDQFGFSTEGGSRQLSFGGGADHFGPHIAVMIGTNHTFYGLNVLATRQKDEPEHADAGGTKSIWFAWRSPSNSGGTVVLDTVGSDFDTALAVYTLRTNATASSFNNLRLVAANDDDPSTPPTSRVKFFSAPNQLFYIAVDGHEGVSGKVNVRLSFGAESISSASDHLANAANFSGEVITGSNAGASKEPGEPQHAGNPGGASVWWKRTLGPGTLIQISTTNSTFDTLLSVYTTNILGFRSGPITMADLVLVAENDDSQPRVRTSTVRLVPPKQGTYWIAVDGYNGAEGNVRLSISSFPLPIQTNNPFASATVLTGSSVLTNGHNFGANSEFGEPQHAGKAATNSLWYRWVAPTNGLVTISTRTSDFDTVLAVYTGSSLTNLTEIASNDDDPANPPTSAVIFHATAGTEYRIALAGYQNARGEFVLALNQTPTLQPRLLTQWLQGKLWLEPEAVTGPAFLESSTDLVTWRVVRTIQPGDPAIAITTDTGLEKLFFRLREQ